MNRDGPHLRRQRCRMYVQQLGAVLGVLCLFAQAMPLFHFLAVGHVRCSEHGDWVHAGGAHEPTPNSAAELAPAEKVAGNASAQHGDHEHCTLCADSVANTWLGRRASGVGAASTGLSAGMPTECAQVPTAAVYLFAPKTSPPA